MLSLLFSEATVLPCIQRVWPSSSSLFGHTQQGPPVTINHLQEAAGAFAFLRDVAGLRVEQPRPVDISPEAAGEALTSLWIII